MSFSVISDELSALLPRLADATSWEERLDLVSASWLGRPYVAHSLIGSATHPEELVVRLDAFDCVTFVESVIAVASSSKPEDFAPALTSLRYDRGRIGWPTRNHYMTDWIERNARAGFVEPLASPLDVEEIRTLSALPDYPAAQRTVRWVPRERIAEVTGTLRTGDLVCFVSTRPELDTFHVGLLVAGPVLTVRHAARSLGGVVEEPLTDFLERNETPGLLLARPLERAS